MKPWPIALPLHETAEGLGAGAPADVDAPPVADDGGSLSEHEASFSPEARQDPAPDAAERGDNGQFKPRHRAASQRADVDDVPTINAHTARIKAAEAKLGADIVKQAGESERAFTLRRRAELLERQAATPAPVARREEPAPRQEPPSQPAAQSKAAEPPADEFTYPTFTQAVEKDPNLDYDRWELNRFNAYRKWDREQATAAAEQAEVEKRDAAIKQDFDTRLNGWHERRVAFLAKHPQRAPAVSAFLERIDASTPIGGALLHSDAGLEIADYLAANPDEAQRIGALNPFQQILELGKLETTLVASQRPTPSTRTAAALTGSAPALVRPPAPRPPNPVRTGSIAEPDTPPDVDDQSLSSHEKFYGRKHR